MEGYLKRWMGVISRWKKSYFILHNSILVYCNSKGEQVQGSIHLRISAIVLIPDDPLRIIINSGTNEIHVRAATIAEKIKWVNALRNAQEESFKEEEVNVNYEIREEEEKNSSSKKKTVLRVVDFQKIDDDLAEIWSTKAYFDETLSLVGPLVPRESNLFEQLEKLQDYGHQLKRQVTTVTKYLEAEKHRLFLLAKQIELRSTQLGSDTSPLVLVNEQKYFINKNEKTMKNGEYLDNTIFESFIDDLDPHYNNNNILKRKLSFSSIPIKGEINETKGNVPLKEVIEELQMRNPDIHKILIENKFWKNIKQLSTETSRKLLPFLKDPNQKLNIWGLLKDMIGKDLARFAVPVYLNEPLSMLQRFSEQFDHMDMLEKAIYSTNQYERMAYAMMFGIVPYSSTIGRNNKPFNPLLGETFELLDPNGKFRFISEQVSHHPPISAGYCESENFEYWSNTHVKTTFWGASLEIKPMGPAHLKLKKTNDHFIWNKAKTGVYGFILGSLYVDNFGEMNFENVTTRDTGRLVLKQRGWGGKGAYETTGSIYDSSKRERYKIEGRWDLEFTLLNCDTGEKQTIWQRRKLPEKSDWQFNFSEFAIELNHLTPDLLKHLPMTDCRLRPDQRALEMGLIELASEEKFRLEEKQRARRKEYEKNGKVHLPRWFEEKIDDITKEREFYYLGGYWEAREKGAFKELLDIY